MTSATLTRLSLRASRPWPIQALRFLGTFLAAWFALELVVTSPPTLVHGLIGSWQLFERTYPVEFSMVMLAASLGVPMFVFLFGDRFFACSQSGSQVNPTYQEEGS